MRILLANKFNHIRGGADKYFLDLADQLVRRGAEVAKFAMAHPANLPDRMSVYFPTYVNYNQTSLWSYPRLAGRLLWNFEAGRKFERLIQDFRPDLIHLHNIYHQLSPSLITAAKRRGVPVALHLHDYKSLCPNYKMYNRQGICERCRGGRYYNCARYACVKESRAKSLLAALEMYLHHRLLGVFKKIDLFIAPSEFMAEKYLEWGGDPGKLVRLDYFIETADFQPDFRPGDYFLFFGRIAEEKGVETLVDAFARGQAEWRRRGIKLRIVGSGPSWSGIEARIRAAGLETLVEYLGPKYGEELRTLVRESLGVVVPSVWYEVAGIVLMEAGALGKPVVASRIGGIKEIVADGETGYLFTPGDSADLADKLLAIADSRDLEKMGRSARSRILSRYGEKEHIDRLLGIYNRLVAKK